jgi:tetratricopeptide (TPR) repeat protein
MKNLFTTTTIKTVLLAAGIATLAASNAMAFSETEFKTAVKQLVSTPTISQEQYVANAVTAWLNQDYINSLAQAEIDASRTANQQAANTFSNLLKQEPGNPLLMSYAGAATAKSSLDKFAKGEKTTALENGTAMVEQALQLADNSPAMHGSVPVALEVRFVAASTYLAVPKIMNRQDKGEQLLKDVIDAQQFAQTDVNFRGAVWMRAATLAAEKNQTNEAKKYLNEIVKNNAPQAQKATQLLQTLS